MSRYPEPSEPPAARTAAAPAQPAWSRAQLEQYYEAALKASNAQSTQPQTDAQIRARAQY